MTDIIHSQRIWEDKNDFISHTNTLAFIKNTEIELFKKIGIILYQKTQIIYYFKYV